MSILGTTHPLDTYKYPLVKGPYSKGDVVIGSNKPHTVGEIPLFVFSSL